MDDIFAFFAFCAVVSVIAMMFVRTFVDFLVLLLVIVQPLSHVSFIPRGLFGITGANPANLIWCLLFAVIILELAGRRKGIALSPFFSLPVFLFFMLFLIAVLRSATDMESFHVLPNRLLGKSPAHFILQELLKPTQILLTGWVIWIYCRMRGSDETVRLALWSIPIVVAPIVAGYFLFGSMNGGYMRGRAMVSTSLGMHANDLGAFAVYLLAFALFSSDKSRRWLRAAAIGSAILIIVMSFSRMAFLATGFIAALGFKRIGKFERKALVIALVLVLSVFFAELASRVQHGFGEESTDAGDVSAGRIDNIWIPLIPQVLESPIAGEGVLTIRKSEAAQRGLVYGHPHNAYIEILIDLGLIGLLGFGFMVYWFWTCSRVLPEFRYAVVGWLCMGLTGNSFYPTSANFPIWILYGMSLFVAEFRRPVPSSSATTVHEDDDHATDDTRAPVPSRKLRAGERRHSGKLIP